MYTITILRLSPKSQKSFERYVGPQKGPNLDQKRPKMGRAKFFRTVNLNFPKEDHKNSFYAKNHQNSMNRLEYISYKTLILGQKGANLDQTGFKMGVARFLLDCKHQFFKKDHKIG